jgi:hypothetical protein
MWPAKPKGSPKTPGSGRKKGSINKKTASVKEALAEAFELMGGVQSLLKWGRANPKDFYPLWTKMLPTDIKAEIHGGITLTPVINLSGRPEPQEIEPRFAPPLLEAPKQSDTEDQMAIRFVDDEGNMQILAGHDPKAKCGPVDVEKPSNGFRTKGPDAQVNRLAALEAENRAQAAKINKLEADLLALRRAAESVSKTNSHVDIPVDCTNTKSNNLTPSTFDRNAYQREYMRKRREAERQQREGK